MPSDAPGRPGSPNQDGRWVRVSNGIAVIVIGFALFALGVIYGLGPIEVLSAFVIVGGGLTVMIALVRLSGD